MKIYLISNNLLLEGLNYDFNANLETIRLTRPLSIKGEMVAKKISELSFLNEVEKIITSYYSCAISTSKYLAQKLEINIELNENFNDCKVGNLGSKNMKMVKGLQDHEFTYKLPNGESLVDVGNRFEQEILKLVKEKSNMAIFSHKRGILGYLLKHSKVGYNLDENLILEFNGNIIYDDSDTEYDIYELTFVNKEIKSIIRL